MKVMNMKDKIKEDTFEVLLQRYRQDGYEAAKIQRNELASRDADRAEIIKKAF